MNDYSDPNWRSERDKAKFRLETMTPPLEPNAVIAGTRAIIIASTRDRFDHYTVEQCESAVEVLERTARQLREQTERHKRNLEK